MIFKLDQLTGEEKALLCEIFNKLKYSSIEANFDTLPLYKKDFVNFVLNKTLQDNILTDEGIALLKAIYEKIELH